MKNFNFILRLKRKIVGGGRVFMLILERFFFEPNQKLNSLLTNKKRGVSLLMGIGIIFIMVFFALLVSNVVVSSIRQSANITRSNEAYYLAEGALEVGLLKNFIKTAGYTTDNFQSVDLLINSDGALPNDDDDDDDESAGATPHFTAGYKIQGIVPEEKVFGGNSEFANNYGVPTAGTGNAGSYCDTVNPFLNEKFDFEIDETTGITTYSTDEGKFDPADHPCNWNKISTGQTVTIPLYKMGYEDGEYGEPVNLFGKNADEILKVRLRTPCAYDGTGFPPEMCESSERFELQDNELILPKNDPILTWQIYGFNEDGKPVTLEPVVKYNLTPEITHPYHIATEKHINNVNNNKYVIFDQYSLGKDLSGKEGCLWHFLGGEDNIFQPFCHHLIYRPTGENVWGENHKLSKPVLKLSVIGNLIDKETKNSIPYLEYQIITSSDLTSAPVNTAQIITGEGISGTFKHILKVSIPHLTGLPDYVVQQ